MSEGASRAVITPVTNTHMSAENSCSDPNRMCHPTQQVPLHTRDRTPSVNHTLQQCLGKRAKKQHRNAATNALKQQPAMKGLFCKMQEAEKIPPVENNTSGLQIGGKFGQFAWPSC